MNFYEEMQSGGESSALAKLEKAIIDMKIVLKGVKPERNFKTTEVKNYFNMDGRPQMLLDKLEFIKQTFKN